MNKKHSLVNLLNFSKRFLKPYLFVIIMLVFLNMVPGFLMGLRPLVLAPALGRVLPGDAQPATSISDITLDNLGATLQSFIALPGNDIGAAFLISGSLYLLVSTLIAITGGAVKIWSMFIRLKILKNMITALHEHLMGLHLGYFSKQQTGDLISRFSTDLTKTAGSIETVFSGIMNSSVQVAVYTIILFRAEPVLSVQVLLIGTIHMVITQLMGGRVKRWTKVAYDRLASLTAALQESFQNIRIIKSFSVEGFDSKKIEREAESVRQKHFRFILIRYLEDPIRLFTDGLVIAAILYISYQSIIDKRMTIAGMALFFYMATQLIVPVTELSRQCLNVYGIQGGFSRLVDIFQTSTNLADGSKDILSFQKSIILDDVFFRYDPKTPVLQNISMVIKRGETIGVVGASGGGKSTLIDLILRLYDPTSGRIICDGQNIREYTQKSYRRLFGVVTQESLLFNTSIRNNILLGRPDNKKDLRRACRIANIDALIDKSQDGLETEVGDRGIRLSGGQRQRIAIARAVYAYPEILILDEATSSLDTNSERDVQKAIEKAIEGVTAIIIAHRLSTIIHADKIVVLENGKVESIGTHEELLRKSSVYAKLNMYQFEPNQQGISTL